MSRNFKFHNADGNYFVSFPVVEWLDVFKRKGNKEIILNSLNYCQQKRDMEIFAWCIMSNHVHLVFRIAGDLRPEELLGRFKQFTSRGLLRDIKTNPKESRGSNFWQILRMPL